MTAHRAKLWFSCGVLLVLGLSCLSLTVGVSEIGASTLVGLGSEKSTLVYGQSRVPRTVALLLVGCALGVTGLIMQLLTRNRFVEPATAGTGESAGLGLLVAMILAPELPLIGKMIVATGFALGGTLLFFALLSRVSSRSVLVVPLVGIMLGRVIDAVTTFFAYRFDLLQSVNAWTLGDFSHILAGRYELLWIAGVLAVAAYWAADRFTLAGLGEAFTTNLGLPYRKLLLIGLLLVSMITATTVVTVGLLPLFGLVVPNVVSLYFGDNARRSIPWVMLLGAGLMLACDLLGRTLRAPYEIPVGVIIGVLGALGFFILLLRKAPRLG